MGSKTISVDDEAYALLKAAKIGEESFSDVVKRALSPRRAKITDLVGLLSEEDGRRVAATVRKLREDDRKTAKARYDRLWK